MPSQYKDMFPTRLRTNRLQNPLGISKEKLGLSWEASAGQEKFEIRLSDQSGSFQWTSGEVSSGDSQFTVPKEVAICSRTAYTWQVRTRLGEEASQWSEKAEFETNIDSSELSASWIGRPINPKKIQTLYFRKEIEIPELVVNARAYSTALGWYHLYINDSHVTGHSVVPRWTPIHKELEFQAFDVTNAFKAGTNVIGIAVSEGRYRGTLGFANKRAQYGDKLACFVQIELLLADGSSMSIRTDESWQVGRGQIISADPMKGEIVDARVNEKAWLLPGGNVIDSLGARVLEHPTSKLVCESVERVRDVQRLRPKILKSRPGSQLIDFGQNFSGVVKVRLHGPSGSVIKLRYSEVLTPEGELDTKYLSAKGGEWFQTDTVTLGSGPYEYIPRFSTHGFRYLSVEGKAQLLRHDDVEGIFISTDLEQTAVFSASDPRLEQLWRNVTWSMRSNFTDTPTDCPTRERSGWTGDIQVFGPTAAQLYDSAAFLDRYLHNLSLEQKPDGSVPVIIPGEEVPGYSKRPLNIGQYSAGWGDVSVMLPWTHYTYFGDKEILERQYDSAKAWVDCVINRASRKSILGLRGRKSAGKFDKYVVDSAFHWGEWLRPGSTLMGDIFGIIPDSRADVATAYLANSARLLAEIAEVLGKKQDAAKYREIAGLTRTAWQKAFVRKGGKRISRDRQDDYVRALAFGLLPPHHNKAAFGRLIELIEKADNHLQTGFLSTPLLLGVLVDGGRADKAYQLLMQTSPPSWLGQVELGATTTWETWEGYKKNGEAHESHNHYAFGSVVQFLHERVAGLQPIEPGYRRVKIAPIIGGGLTSAGMSLRTSHGTVETSWERIDNEVSVSANIPIGCSAILEFNSHIEELPSGRHVRTFPYLEQEESS